MPFDPMKDLDSYLNDHLAGSISALELIAHWVEVHKAEPLRLFFVEIEREIKADQDKLREVMNRNIFYIIGVIVVIVIVLKLLGLF